MMADVRLHSMLDVGCWMLDVPNPTDETRSVTLVDLVPAAAGGGHYHAFHPAQ